ncbi:DUF6188 family protein [Kitasatospora phosalacinea]|uniref:DUF6188 family protein n=1 Tax=Kitasatospora phosalacinea TaxID=2065 RepID=A0ABW6GP61_9ACTN
MENEIDRADEGWDVRSMRGVGIGELVVGDALRLHAGSNRIEVHCPAELTTDHETVPVHAATRTNLDRLPQLLDQVLSEVRAADAGSLRVRFANGWRLDVPVSSGAFGWVVGLRSGCSVSSLPGGGVRTTDRPGARGAVTNP